MKSNRLILFGFLFITLNIITGLYINQYDIQKTFFTFIPPVFSSIGVALIIIGLVESRHLKKSLENLYGILVNSLEKTASEIVDKSSKRLDEKFEETFTILENCIYNGLENILPPRQDGEMTREIIGKEIEKTNKIFIVSISGLDFFGSSSGADASSGKYYNIISKRIESAKKTNKELKMNFKALLMNPNSKVAEFRNLVEEIDGRQGTVKNDIEIAKKGIENLNNSFNKLPNQIKLNKTKLVEYLFYSEFPQIGFILTDSYVFIELYHFAFIEEFCNALNELNLPASNTINNCIGGRIPVFQFQKESNTYIAVEKHFDSIWKYTENNGQINAFLP